MSDDKKPLHEIVAEKLIRQLREGTAPWQKPWSAGEGGTFMPLNPVTGKRYKGINALHLMSEGREDQRWMTYKQAEAMDAQVRKGERGTQIQYWKFTEEQVKTDSTGKSVIDASGAPVRDTVRLERPRVFFATVFNAEQIDGLPPLTPRKPHSWDPVGRAEQILLASGAVIKNSEHDRAFYRPSTDSIHLPDRSRFPTANNYYATALHELGHWTGHTARLARDLSYPFGSEGYAREELRAEIASMILGDELGIGHDPAQHAAYVGSWIKVLQQDPLEIFRAAADAEKIQDYVLGLEQTQVEKLAMVEQPSSIDLKEAAVELPQPNNAIQASNDRTEAWLLSSLERGTLASAADHADVAQLERMQEVLTAMTPVETDNPFCQRHALPDKGGTLLEKIDHAQRAVAQRRADAPVVSARQALLTAQPGQNAHDRSQAAFDAAAREALGFTLPGDWNGAVQIEGSVSKQVDGRPITVAALASGLPPESWSVFAQQVDGGATWLTNCATEAVADALAERLKLIDAHSTINEYEKTAKLARINEERVRRDPGSTDEDIAAAKEARKDAEFKVVTHDGDLQRRIEMDQQQRAATRTAVDTRPDRPVEPRLLIDVPYRQKDEAKALGAKWDRKEQSWYVPAGLDAGLFAKWIGETASAHTAKADASQRRSDGVAARESLRQRQYLAVPYRDRALAKAAGAEWDKAAKSWYAGPTADMRVLEKWSPEKSAMQQDPAMTPREEFAEALRSLGCVVSGEHPVMDGKTHRITVEGEKFSKNSGSGFYVGHLDGHPAGYIKNNKTGVELNWKSKGYVLDPALKAQLAADANAKMQLREAAVLRQHEQAARRVARQMLKLVQVELPTPYMVSKGIAPQPGALTDGEGRKTYLPVSDIDGKQWSMQYIHDDGTKRFARDSRKDGCFHVVGGMDQLADAPVLVIGEGYATAAQLKQALGFPTVCAFDSGNLAPVALALRQKFPNKPIVIAGDDDRHLEMTQGVNPGRTKAEEAARLVDGKVLLPVFAPGENSFPDEVAAVTPAKYREHRITGCSLSTAQLAALDRVKQFTDFNDLDARSELGGDAVSRQVCSIVDSLLAQSISSSELRERRNFRLVADPLSENVPVNYRGVSA